MPEYEDFQEIAHCGGKVTIHVESDSEGRLAYRTGFQHDRPGPASVIAIYALMPQGIPMADLQLGGVGPPADPQGPDGCCPVFLGSDSQQCWGHQCPQCQGYFRNGAHPAVYPLTCPYCGYRDGAHRFLTDAQRAYVQHYAVVLMRGLEEVAPGSELELVIDMDAITDLGADQQKPEFYYAAVSQQTRFKCGKCGQFNDLRGRYGYCAACGWRNNVATMKACFGEMRERLNGGHASPVDIVRSAVSEFDACCRNIASEVRRRVPMKPARSAELERFVFHDLESQAFVTLKSMFDIDILRGLSDGERRFVRMMMHRRHVFEHNGGVMDTRYVRLSGDPTAQEGVLIREDQANAHRLIAGLTRMGENLDSDFHEVFPPTEWPIRHYRTRQERMRQRRDAR
jgi:hypothetical protein